MTLSLNQIAAAFLSAFWISAVASPSLYRCEIEGRTVLLRTEPNAWTDAAVQGCTSLADAQGLHLPHRPPEPSPLNWPVVLTRAEPIVWRMPDQARPLSASASATGVADKVRDFSAKAGLSYQLVMAVIDAESAFNHRARSPKGALGLMQIMPSTARDYGTQDPNTLLEIDENLRVGTTHLKKLMLRFGGDVPLALAAYNAGEGAVIRHGWRIPPFQETQSYVQKIMESL